MQSINIRSGLTRPHFKSVTQQICQSSNVTMSHLHLAPVAVCGKASTPHLLPRSHLRHASYMEQSAVNTADQQSHDSAYTMWRYCSFYTLNNWLLPQWKFIYRDKYIYLIIARNLLIKLLVEIPQQNICFLCCYYCKNKTNAAICFRLLSKT